MMAMSTTTIRPTTTTSGWCAAESETADLFSFANVWQAYMSCRRRKAGAQQAQRYALRLLDHIENTAQALQDRSYKPARSLCFVAHSPKAREIHAAAFADRVVHHLLVPRLEAVYEPIFIHDVYSNPVGKGTHAAVERLQTFMRRLEGQETVGCGKQRAPHRSRWVRFANSPHPTIVNLPGHGGNPLGIMGCHLDEPPRTGFDASVSLSFQTLYHHLVPRLRRQRIAYCLVFEAGYLKGGLKQRLLHATPFIKPSMRGNTMSIKPCWLLIASLAAVNGTALAACNNAIPPSTPDAAFTLHADGTVTHTATGLMWMRCALGQTWNGAACGGAVLTYTWQAALQAADGYAFAGYGDWRLPNKNELASIVEDACYNPAINIVAFPNAPASFVWSSSPHAYYSNDAWGVNFFDGRVYGGYEMGNGFHVRLVRGGQ